MKIKFKLEEGVTPPIKGTNSAACWDLHCHNITHVYFDERNDVTNLSYIEYDTGLSIEIPEGYYGMVIPRSSISNTYQILTNSVGIIDSDYRGTIKMRTIPISPNFIEYKKGERCCQLMIKKLENYELVQTEELSSTKRGKGGFGSTGKKELKKSTESKIIDKKV